MAMKTFKTILGGRIVTGLEMRSQREKILSRDFFRKLPGSARVAQLLVKDLTIHPQTQTLSCL